MAPRRMYPIHQGWTTSAAVPATPFLLELWRAEIERRRSALGSRPRRSKDHWR
jgi:hypothetical protein